MKCRLSYLLAFALLVCSFMPAFFTSGDSLAVSDISVTYNSVPSQYQDVFPSCSGDCLNSYSYLIVEINSPLFNTSSAFNMFDIRFDGSFNRNFGISLSSPYSIYTLPFDGHPNNYLYFRGNLPSDVFNSGVTFTLTDSLNSSSPSGSLSITENGTYDVSSYAEAVVNVPSEVIPGDYHDDLQELKQVALLVPAVLLLIYFFWAIYKMIMGGVKR